MRERIKGSTLRQRASRRAVVALAATTAGLGVGLASAPAASAATYLGGVNVAMACIIQHGNTTAKVIYPNVMGWRCVAPNGAQYGVSMNQACVYQYGAGAYSAYVNFNNPYSWYCER